jgi:hypothetical protein
MPALSATGSLQETEGDMVRQTCLTNLIANSVVRGIEVLAEKIDRLVASDSTRRIFFVVMYGWPDSGKTFFSDQLVQHYGELHTTEVSRQPNGLRARLLGATCPSRNFMDAVHQLYEIAKRDGDTRPQLYIINIPDPETGKGLYLVEIEA